MQVQEILVMLVMQELEEMLVAEGMAVVAVVLLLRGDTEDLLEVQVELLEVILEEILQVMLAATVERALLVEDRGETATPRPGRLVLVVTEEVVADLVLLEVQETLEVLEMQELQIQEVLEVQQMQAIRQES